MNDLISRQAAIDALIEWYGCEPNDMDYFEEILAKKSSAQPERKKGRWLKKMLVTETEKYTSYDPEWYCACCGAKYDPYIAKIVNFCYVCGEDMRGEQE